jgi:predicted nuclease of predicted toxin-antitoxin system
MALRRQSIDVTTVEMGLRGQTDEAQLAFACQQGRVLVTHDTDFSENCQSKHRALGYCFL